MNLVNREKMAVPEEVKEFNKQVCSDFLGFVYVFMCSSYLFCLFKTFFDGGLDRPSSVI